MIDRYGSSGREQKKMIVLRSSKRGRANKAVGARNIFYNAGLSPSRG
jgi:hypothetical protein